jgi:hypothetical protein
MSNPALFFAIAGIAMSFAGFAGLFLALRPRDSEWQRYEVGQINTIVLFALLALFSALLVVPLASLLGEQTALRVMGLGVFVAAFYAHQVRLGTSWVRWGQVRSGLSRGALVAEIVPFALVAIADQVLLAVNVFAPSQELYELALILMLATPAFVFVLVVTRFGSTSRR